MGSKTPAPSAAEVNLQNEQAQMIRDNRDLAKQMYSQQQLLSPFMYKQMGLKPIYATDERPAWEQQKQELSAQLTGLAPVQGRGMWGELIQQVDPRAQTLREQIGALDKRIAGFDPTKIVSFAEEAAGAGDPFYAQKQEIQKLQFDRSLAALKGELPVDQGLTNDLGRQEESLREQLRRDLGTGYELSTPGMRRLEEFNLRKNQLLDGARRGDLTLAEQMSQAREGFNQQMQDTSIARFSNPWAQAFTMGSNASGLAGQMGGNLLGYMQGNRQMIQQNRQFNSGMMGGFINQGIGAAGMAAGMFAPKPCMIAEELYGKDSPKVHKLRADLVEAAQMSTVIAALVNIYAAYGDQVVEQIKINPEMRAKFQILFDAMTTQ
jgi:hypothetical protein